MKIWQEMDLSLKLSQDYAGGVATSPSTYIGLLKGGAYVNLLVPDVH